MVSKTLQLVPLDQEARTTLPTKEAARHLSRAEQTLYHWSHYGTYPACLTPQKVRGRLAWPVAGIRQALAEGA